MRLLRKKGRTSSLHSKILLSAGNMIITEEIKEKKSRDHHQLLEKKVVYLKSEIGLANFNNKVKNWAKEFNLTPKSERFMTTSENHLYYKISREYRHVKKEKEQNKQNSAGFIGLIKKLIYTP